jgi:glycosyltransferase involved in cell wall biosynthesis
LRPDSSIFIFTSSFPYDAGGETYLLDEIPVLLASFSTIYLLPQTNKGVIFNLPANCSIIEPPVFYTKPRNPFIYLKIFSWVMMDMKQLLKGHLFLKMFRQNVSQLLRNYSAAVHYQAMINKTQQSPAVYYSYWSSNTATIISILKTFNKRVRCISRAHGYDIFEEQTLYKYIPFRKFQLTYLDAMYSVSLKGKKHLTEKNPDFIDKIKSSYLGVGDQGEGLFNSNSEIIIATCSHIRAVKRLDLMPEILRFITTPITWYVLGDGEDMEKVRSACSSLANHIKVVFKGNLTKEELNLFYKTQPIDIFVSLSSSEGLPVSMMEAISFGIPLMSTDVGGCNEICNERTGFLIPTDFDSKEVAELLVDFKRPAKNTIEFRKGVRAFWKENFDAEINYKRFAKEIIDLEKN